MYNEPNTKRLQLRPKDVKQIAEGADLSILPFCIASSSENRILKNCEFPEPVNLSEKTASPAVKHIEFENCIFLNKLNIDTRQALSFRNCKFSYDVSVSNAQFNVRFSDCLLEGSLNIKGVHDTVTLSLEESEVNNINVTASFNGTFELLTVKISDALNLIQATFSKKLSLRYIEAKVINFGASNFTTLVEVSKTNCKYFNIADTTFNGDLHCFDVKADRISVACRCKGTIYFAKIEISDNVSIVAQWIKALKLETSKLKGLLLSGTVEEDGIFKVSESTIEILSIIDFKNLGLISFIGILLKEEFTLHLSDLKKTDFINCEMMSAKWLFHNSKINEIFAAQTDFPLKVYDQNGENHTQAQLAFGQLSIAMKSMGNTVQAMEYQAREIHAHFKTTPWFKYKNNPLSFHFAKVSLWLNYISNQFGRNWARAAFFSFATGAVGIWALTVSTKKYEIGLPPLWDERFFSAYVRFMNPLRFYETENIYGTLGDPGLTWASYLIDFLARILIGYGFYQTIQAFRRYGKS